ncbi:leucine-rich repeat domain-containing protein [Treponema sp. OMZ 803]|uniref:leucine-rich repeat domain-containing protein n=1 Tax=Treponema sp. OMZ 803 TaxID=120682 RepID=UPI0020A34DEA|nr:leucine-rich repeat domain-containing protein [Treponema sp. OMZ 803]UTC54175.1 leucine-rich repeat domain-containing protein [Treponema sp. OMZ 803]
MTKCRIGKKAHTLRGAAALIIAVFLTLLFTGCPNAHGNKPATPKYTVTFSVDGGGGTLTAKIGETEIKTDTTVEQGKTVTFTATPDKGYKVKGWTLDGNAVNGTAETYTLTVTQPATITVSFEPKKAILTLEAGKNTVKVKAKTADGSAIKVEGCNETELASNVETTLTAKEAGTQITLIGDITELNCSGEETPGGNRPLIALDASGCTALQKLNCQYNNITELDVQGLTALQELDCRTNQIPELNVQGLTKLQKLNCIGNELTTLNVQGLTALQELDCNNNTQLATLDVQGCTALQKLNCGYNQLKTLNVSDCTALQELICDSNKIPELNVQGLTKLQKLDCEGNKLTTLNVQGLTKLQQLYCSNNQLTALNVQSCTALKKLECFQNKLNADAFTKLFNDLPAREVSDKAKALLYADQTASEENCKNFSQPESLKKAFEDAKNVKHWKMQKMKGYIEEDI